MRSGRKMPLWTQESKFGKEREQEKNIPFLWIGHWLWCIFRKWSKKRTIWAHGSDGVWGRGRFTMDTSSKCVGHGHHHNVCLVQRVCRSHQRNTRETECTGHKHQERLKVTWASFSVPIVPILEYAVYSWKTRFLCVSLFRPGDWSCRPLHQSRGDQATDKQT